jgi:hypothetical protein
MNANSIGLCVVQFVHPEILAFSFDHRVVDENSINGGLGQIQYGMSGLGSEQTDMWDLVSLLIRSSIAL